jgi:phage-related protein
MGSSLKDLRAMPPEVRQDIGYALHVAQIGEAAPNVKAVKGFGSGVLEVVENHDGNTFRAVYTVRFADAVYVLHVFQKRSTIGIKTPQKELDVVRVRLQAAEQHYRKTRGTP